MTGVAGELGGALVIAGATLAFLLAAELWARLGRPPPEWPRKLMHLGGLVPCLLLPFAVRSPWIVAAMGVALSGFFRLGSACGFLRCLHAVDRPSRGSEYYPLAVAFLFLVARERPWLYVSALLVAGVADALAALVGKAYGRLRYEVEDEQKSLEGSLAFLVVAFLAVHLPLLFLTRLPRESCVLAALLTAIVVTCFEAVSLRGADNLFIPIGVYAILDRVAEKPVEDLAVTTLRLVALLAGIGVLVWRLKPFNTGGALVFVLFAYGAWALGTWSWVLPPLLGFLLYVALRLAVPPPPDYRTRLKVRVVTRAHLPPLVLLVLANATGAWNRLEGPFVATYASVVSIAIWIYLQWRRPTLGWRRPAGALAVAALSWAVVAAVPGFLVAAAPGALAGTLGVVALVSLAHDCSMGRVDVDDLWPASRFLLACGAALALLLAQWGGLTPLWRGR